MSTSPLDMLHALYGPPASDAEMLAASGLAPDQGSAATADLEARVAPANRTLGNALQRQQTQQPPAQVAAAPRQPGGPLNFFKNMLRDFAQGGGDAMLKSVGLPTYAEKMMMGAQVAHLLASTDLIHQQAQQMNTMVPLLDPYGRPMTDAQGNPVMMPAATMKVIAPLLGRSYGAQVSGQYGLTRQGLANQGQIDVANARRVPQAQLAQQFLDAVNNGDEEGANSAIEQLSRLSAATTKPAKAGDFGQFYSKYLNDNGLDDTADNMLVARKQWEIRPLQPGAIDARNTARADRSYQYHSGAIDKLGSPVDTAVSRLGRLQDTLAQNSPQADALVAPELLTIMAGGQGSGLRLNEAEIARVINGRSNWEALKASINKWSTDPASANSITPAQRQQIRALVNEVNNRLLAKQQILDNARQQLIASDDPTEHKRIYADARAKLSAVDKGGAATAPPPGSRIRDYTQLGGR